MTQEVLKQMYQLLLTEPHAPTVCAQLERIAREALADHAMRKVQRLGQEIEQKPVPPPWWPAVENILAEHGLQAIDFVADFKNALAQEQEPVAWKLVPIEPTKEMLEAMDECSTEGYDERLYAGHAASVYMAAVDVAPTPPQRTEQEPVIDGNTSDGYHTFNELYEFRKAYNIALFNEWAANGKCSVHKSWRHDDGELCFGGGWFIVVAVLPQGQISNHYEAKDWDLFHIQETGKALFEFDGHTGADVIERLKSYTTPPQRTWVGLTDEDKHEIELHAGITEDDDGYIVSQVFKLTEAKLKEKNT